MSESRLKENAAAVRKLFGTAAKLAQKQAALATLNNVTLPKLYHAIGKKIVGLEKLPPDLVPHREKIRALEAGIAAKPEEPQAAPAEGFAAKAKQFAQQAAHKASKATADAAATMQIPAAYVALGKEAVEKHGDKAVPKELLSEFLATTSRIAELTSELEGPQKGSTTMPSAAATLAVVLYCSAWLLPFIDHSGICNGAQVLWAVSSESWFGLMVVALAQVCAVAGLSFATTHFMPPKPLSWLFWCGLAVCVVLNTCWFFTYRGAFFTGFYAWYVCFLLIAYAVFGRTHYQWTAGIDKALWGSLSTIPLPVGIAFVCYAISWTMPTFMVTMDEPLSGWQTFRIALMNSWVAWLSAITNIVAIAGLGLLISTARPSASASRLLLAGALASICVNSIWIFWTPAPLLFGFYLWFGSFCFLAVESANAWRRAGATDAEPAAVQKQLSRFATAGIAAALLVVLPTARSAVKTLLVKPFSGEISDLAASSQHPKERESQKSDSSESSTDNKFSRDADYGPETNVRIPIIVTPRPAHGMQFPPKRKVRELPAELEEYRRVIAVVEDMYRTSGRTDVPTAELLQSTLVLTAGSLGNGDPVAMAAELRELATVARSTKTDVKTLVKNMKRELVAGQELGGSRSIRFNSYSGSDSTPASLQLGQMICPTCRGTGNTNPDNPASGGTCILCAGSGIRKIGE